MQPEKVRTNRNPWRRTGSHGSSLMPAAWCPEAVFVMDPSVHLAQWAELEEHAGGKGMAGGQLLSQVNEMSSQLLSFASTLQLSQGPPCSPTTTMTH